MGTRQLPFAELLVAGVLLVAGCGGVAEPTAQPTPTATPPPTPTARPTPTRTPFATARPAPSLPPDVLVHVEIAQPSADGAVAEDTVALYFGLADALTGHHQSVTGVYDGDCLGLAVADGIALPPYRQQLRTRLINYANDDLPLHSATEAAAFTSALVIEITDLRVKRVEGPDYTTDIGRAVQR